MVKFESITFNIKDVIMILGGVISGVGFLFQMDSRLDEFELKISKIEAQNAIDKVEVNAKFDGLKQANNGTKKHAIVSPIKVAIIPDNRIEIKKKKLFQYKLI